jgi:hypothetical protein
MDVNGETDLRTLLRTMQPCLHETPYIFCSIQRDVLDGLTFDPLGIFREREGVTVIATQQQANAHGFPMEATWACITLTVHSSLSAVGFLAAITGRLAQAGISVNPISAYYHDHLFVPWEKRRQALEALELLSRSQ